MAIITRGSACHVRAAVNEGTPANLISLDLNEETEIYIRAKTVRRIYSHVRIELPGYEDD